MYPVKYFQVISCVNVKLVSDISETVSLIALTADDRQRQSEALDINSVLTWLIVQEDFIANCKFFPVCFISKAHHVSIRLGRRPDHSDRMF